MRRAERRTAVREISCGLPRGDVEASYLMHKLRGTHLEVGGAGSIMPLGLGALPEREIAVVATWVRECALDN